MKARSIRPLLLVLLFGCLATRGGRISEYGPEGTTAKSRAVRSDRSDARRVRTALFGPALHRGSRVSPVTVTPRSAQPAAHPLATRARTSIAGPLDPGSPTNEADPTRNEPVANRSGVLAPAQLNAGRAFPEGASGLSGAEFSRCGLRCTGGRSTRARRARAVRARVWQPC